MTSISEFSKEFETFEDSVLFIKGEEERKLRTEFASRIEKLLIEYPTNPDLYHKLGVCLYNKPEWQEEDKGRIETAFHRAILLDSNSTFSIMFLVFFYFDIGRYYLSILCYENLLKKRLTDIPLWRLKRLEGINFACLIYTQQIDASKAEQSIDKLIASYSKLEEADWSDISPVEIIDALKSKRFSNNENVAGKIRQLEDFLDL